MYEALDGGIAGVGKPVLTNVALVISQPMLVMMVQEVLNQCLEVEIRLVTQKVADLATLVGRERIQVIICEPLAAEEIRSLLHREQRLVILARGGTTECRQGDLVVDLAMPSWATMLAALARAPRAHPTFPAERRRVATSIRLRQLVAWLKQHADADVAPENGLGSSAACQRVLGSLPQVGQPTTLIFLGMHRMARHAGDTAPLLQRLRSTLRADDAVFRVDDLTVAALIPATDPQAIPSLLTRLSWRLWPSDPTALAAGYAVWTPGQTVEAVVSAAWARLLGALGLSGTRT